MKKEKIIKIVIIALVILLVIGFILWRNIERNRSKAEEYTASIKIVTSFYPMYIIAENITDGASNIELVNMADVNVGCLHDYTLTTEDMKKVEDADVFITNGLGMENFLEKVINANANMKIIDSSKNIENTISHKEETNAHIWTNTEKYIQQIQNIKDGLQEADSANREVYEANANQYIQEIENLKEEYAEKLQALEGRKAINLNEAFEYLGQELGMEMTTIETDHEESTLSAEMLRTIIDNMKEQDIEMIIVAKEDNKTNAETIANETGAKIYELNSGLTGELEKEAYLTAMEENWKILLGEEVEN